LPVYSRAEPWRTVATAVALFLTAVSTSAVAREFRAAFCGNPHLPKVLCGPIGNDFAPDGFDGLASPESGARPIHDGVQPIRPLASIAAVAEIDARAQRDPAVARPIDRIRKVE
jgi:hypothetical protein